MSSLEFELKLKVYSMAVEVLNQTHIHEILYLKVAQKKEAKKDYEQIISRSTQQ